MPFDPDRDDDARGIGPKYRGLGPRLDNQSRGIGPRFMSLDNGTQRPHGGTAAPPPPPPFLQETLQVVDEQLSAQMILRQLLPVFSSEFSNVAGRQSASINQKIGAEVPVAVLGTTAFAAKVAAQADAQEVEDIAALVRFRTSVVDARLRRAGPNLTGRYPRPLTPTTKILPSDFGFIQPRLQRVEPKRSAGFFFARENVIFLKVGSMDMSVIAHELCHAFTHPAWSELQIRIGAFWLADEMSQVDEGVTSEMANIVLYTITGGRLAQPGGSPNGFVGYPTSVQSAAGRILKLLDGTPSTPGPNARAAYFGGKIKVTMDPKRPDDMRAAIVELGGAKPIRVGAMLP
jgi:hypothetical protein